MLRVRLRGIASPFRDLLDNALFRLNRVDHGEVVLNQRRIFILPTRAGLAYVVLLAGLFIGSVNYSLNMGFALTFLIAGCMLVGLYLTFRNLAWLRLSPGRSPPAFAGTELRFDLHVANHGKHARYALNIGFSSARDTDTPGSVDQSIDLLPFGRNILTLCAPARQRGWQPIPRVLLHTRFPLGLFRAWSTWQPDLVTLIYPSPEENAPPLPSTGIELHGEQSTRRGGDEDFAGVRAWQAGDAINRLAWRQIARMGDASNALISKHFEGGASAGICIDEQQIAAVPLEQRLSRMTRWVLEAEQQGLTYSLRLGSVMLPAMQGPQHRDECLRTLALYRPEIR